MLWSDPPDEPPEGIRREMCEVQAMLRRAVIVIAVCVPVLLAIAGLRA